MTKNLLSTFRPDLEPTPEEIAANPCPKNCGKIKHPGFCKGHKTSGPSKLKGKRRPLAVRKRMSRTHQTNKQAAALAKASAIAVFQFTGDIDSTALITGISAAQVRQHVKDIGVDEQVFSADATRDIAERYRIALMTISLSKAHAATFQQTSHAAATIDENIRREHASLVKTAAAPSEEPAPAETQPVPKKEEPAAVWERAVRDARATQHCTRAEAIAEIVKARPDAAKYLYPASETDPSLMDMDLDSDVLS